MGIGRRWKWMKFLEYNSDAVAGSGSNVRIDAAVVDCSDRRCC